MDKVCVTTSFSIGAGQTEIEYVCLADSGPAQGASQSRIGEIPEFVSLPAAIMHRILPVQILDLVGEKEEPQISILLGSQIPSRGLTASDDRHSSPFVARHL